jgi:hypothetical protein
MTVVNIILLTLRIRIGSLNISPDLTREINLLKFSQSCKTICFFNYSLIVRDLFYIHYMHRERRKTH